MMISESVVHKILISFVQDIEHVLFTITVRYDTLWDTLAIFLLVGLNSR